MRRSSLLAPLALALVWVFAFSVPASAQYFGRNKVQYDDFDFKVFQTEHFEIYYYSEMEESIRDVARMAERWYRRHTRTFLREFGERKPLIFYANDADFQQTNVVRGQIGQGVGGVAESLKERVVMPLTGIYRETDHVLGHELVHSFQYDIALSRADTGRFAMNMLPLWMIEGMAEYLALGRDDPNTAMWLRDAVLRDDLPTMAQLTRDMRYFPYRFGQAYMAYIGGKYGDTAVTNIYKLSGRIGFEGAVVATTGISADSLSTEWQQAVKEAYEPLMEDRTPPDEAGTAVLTPDLEAGQRNISPSVSPDGQYVAFISDRDLFNFDLFVADAETGEVVNRLGRIQSDPHIDAIRFINSAGSWSPDGQRFAFVTYVRGDNQIAIWNVNRGRIERRIKVDGISAMTNPAWSPDGRHIAFSGLDGGLSNIYVLDASSKEVRQLTDDKYSALHPAWSPDGGTIAYSTDAGPGGTDFDVLSYARERIGLIDVDTREVQILRPFSRGIHMNPQFSPDGRDVYFISDHDGFKDVYRYNLDEDATFQITEIQTGVSGISPLSPAMSVASQSGRMMFSVFSDNSYNVYALDPDQLTGEQMASASGIGALFPALPSEHDEVTPAMATAMQETAVRDILPPGRLTDDNFLAGMMTRPDEEPLDESEWRILTPDEIEDGAEAREETSDDASADQDEVTEQLPTLNQLRRAHLRGATAAVDTLRNARLLPGGHFEDDPERPRAAVLPPYSSGREGIVEDYLGDPLTGLPLDDGTDASSYRARMSLDLVAPPQVGVQVGGPFGTGVAGGIGFFFSDMLGNQNLSIAVQANGTFRDIGGQVQYVDLGNRFNYGATAMHMPILRGWAQVGMTEMGRVYQEILQRIFVQNVAGLGSFPLSQTRRFDFQAGFERYASHTEARTYYLDMGQVQRERVPELEFDPIYFFSTSIAYVGDTSYFGFTSPVSGMRFRYEVAPRIGTDSFVRLLADYRRYFFARPFTFAVRALHRGNYGASFDDETGFGIEYLGYAYYPGFVRGYSFGSFTQNECTVGGDGQLQCPNLNNLVGTRLGLASAEIRFPLLGIQDFGLIEFPYVPTEMAIFFDAGMAWTADDNPWELISSPSSNLSERTPVFSTGVSARMNVLGALVMELYYAYPFQRPDRAFDDDRSRSIFRQAVWGLVFSPGW